MSDYLSSAALLADTQSRLKAAALPLVAGRVYASRITGLPEDKFPALLLYVPDRRYEPLGASWQFNGDVSIAVEVQVKYTDAPEAGTWADQAEAIGTAALAALLADAVWRKHWRGPPSIAVKQYLRGRDFAIPHAGAVITITGTPRVNYAVDLAHQRITGADVALTLAQRPDGAATDLDITWEAPE